jgi:predicted phosphodiesterase
MRILVLSDLHIDTCDTFGAFQWNEEQFIAQVENIRESHSIEKVIFNGDTFELMKYRFDEIERAHPALIKYFKDKDFIFIKGNHDIVNTFGFDFYQIKNSLGQTIHIEHGHNAEWFNGSRIGQAIGRFGFSVLKKLSGFKPVMDIYFKIVAKRDRKNQMPKKYNSIKYLTYGLKLLKEHDVVILGHIHKLEAHHTYYMNKKKRYLNSGSCSFGRFQCIVMDTESLIYELIRGNSESKIVPLQVAV